MKAWFSLYVPTYLSGGTSNIRQRLTVENQGGGGTAVTCVVTEFCYRETDSFFIHVHAFTKDELRVQFTEMVSNYRYHLNCKQMESLEAQVEWEKLSKVALDTLEAMFRGRVTGSLLRSKSTPVDETVETLLGWVAELGRGTEHVSSYEVDSLHECAKILARLSTENKTGARKGVAEWPFIKHITVSLNAHILSKGLVLVDLPGMPPLSLKAKAPPPRLPLTEAGLRDLNSARRNITERHLLKCDEILAVCNIGRAVTDASVKEVFDRARQAGLSNVGIICTKSDVSAPI